MAVRKFKLPRVIKICGRRVTVRKCQLLKYDGEQVYGYFEASKNRISIAVAETEHIPDTFLHEVLHAIFYYSGQCENIIDLEEGLVTALEHGLSEILPTLFEVYQLKAKSTLVS